MKGVVLAAGKGVRMRQLTTQFAKPLLPVANTPILGWTLGALRDAGVRDVLLVVGHLQEQVRQAIGDGAGFGLHVDYVEQPAMQGTGEAAMCARAFTGSEPFVLVFGDVLTPPVNVRALVAEFRRHRSDAVMATHRVNDPCTGAAVYVDKGVVTRIVEKPPKGASTTPFDNAGVFVFAPVVYDLLDRVERSPRGEYELTDALHMLTEGRTTLRAFELDGFWSNVTSPEELLRTNRRMLVYLRATNGCPDRVGLHPFAIAADTAHVGDCVIGENVSIGPGSTIGENAALTWTIVCENASIGKGATVEYAFLLPGTRVPDRGSVIGSPGEVSVVGPNEAS
jgi:NDP-sugar pyrophosphorylase family protein